MCKNHSRRDFISGVGKGALALACSSSAFGLLGRSIANASTLQGTGKTLILVNFFGGIDGLNIVVPYNNQIYYDRRPTIAVPASQLNIINNEVGLNKNLTRLYNRLNASGKLALIQQVGYPNPNGSHFESQDIWSLGRRDVSRQDPRGWLGRLADEYFDSNFDMFGIGVSNKIDFLTNKPQVRPIIVNSLEDMGITWDWYSDADNNHRKEVAKLNATIQSSDDALKNPNQLSLKQSLKTFHYVGEDLKQISTNYRSTVTYPEGNYFGGSLREIAKMMQAGRGTQVFYTGIGGWDTHSEQAGSFNGQLDRVDQAFDALISDLVAMGKWQDTAIVCFSEFGRNCFENGSNGTDHGHGNSMLVFGGGVKGGVYGPTPSADDLRQESLGYYLDFRSVFKAAVSGHLGLNPGPVFDELIPAYDVPLDLFS